MSREKRLKESNYTHVIHPFPALYDADSKNSDPWQSSIRKIPRTELLLRTSAEQVLEDVGSGPGREDS